MDDYVGHISDIHAGFKGRNMAQQPATTWPIVSQSLLCIFISAKFCLRAIRFVPVYTCAALRKAQSGAIRSRADTQQCRLRDETGPVMCSKSVEKGLASPL